MNQRICFLTNLIYGQLQTAVSHHKVQVVDAESLLLISLLLHADLMLLPIAGFPLLRHYWESHYPPPFPHTSISILLAPPFLIWSLPISLQSITLSLFFSNYNMYKMPTHNLLHLQILYSCWSPILYCSDTFFSVSASSYDQADTYTVLHGQKTSKPQFITS